MGVHGLGEEKGTKSTLSLHLHTRVSQAGPWQCRGAVRDKRGRSRVSSALVRNKGECEKRVRARNGWRMVSVRDCVVYVTY